MYGDGKNNKEVQRVVPKRSEYRSSPLVISVRYLNHILHSFAVSLAPRTMLPHLPARFSGQSRPSQEEGKTISCQRLPSFDFETRSPSGAAFDVESLCNASYSNESPGPPAYNVADPLQDGSIAGDPSIVRLSSSRCTRSCPKNTLIRSCQLQPYSV